MFACFFFDLVTSLLRYIVGRAVQFVLLRPSWGRGFVHIVGFWRAIAVHCLHGFVQGLSLRARRRPWAFPYLHILRKRTSS